MIRVVLFGKQAEPAASHLGKDSVVFVSGHLRQQERVTHDGQKVRSLEVVAERVEFLSASVSHAVEIARTFIDPPANVPALVDEGDPPSRDE